MPLSLDPHILRAIVSTRSHFVGQLSTPDLLMQIVFPGEDAAWQTYATPGAHSRRYFLVSIRIPDSPSSPDAFAAPATVLPNGEANYFYGPVLEKVTALASVWFGKALEFHGLIANRGVARLPRLDGVRPTVHRHLGAYNHDPRADLGIELCLPNLEGPLWLLYGRETQEALDAFWTATRFYARAVNVYNSDPESAFLDLMIALEVIASQLDVPKEELYDVQAHSDLAAIDEKLCKPAAKRVRNRYFQIGKKIRYAAKSLVNDRFFEATRVKPESYRLTRDNLDGCVKAAYDLRCRYSHGGVRFGSWLAVMRGAEVQVGHPVLPSSDQRLERLLASIPTFAGLERLTRFVILRFGHLHIGPLHDCLE